MEPSSDNLIRNGDDGAVEVKPVNGDIYKSSGEEEIVISGGNEVIDEKANCEVEDIGGNDSDVEQNVPTDKSQQSSVDGETLSVAEDKADHKKELANVSEDDNTKMDVDSLHENEENVGLNETKDDKHSESAQVLEEPTQLSKGEANKGNSSNRL